MTARKVRKVKSKQTVRRVRPVKPAPVKSAQVLPAERPVDYTHEVGEEILERMAEGETATQICRDPRMPRYHVLRRWERDIPEFGRRFDIARKQCCEYHTDEIISIADDSTNDYVERLAKNGVPYTAFNREGFERSRLRVDARKWTASKILRHVYGEKSEVDLRTPDGVNVKVEERNALIDSIVKLVSPKADGQTKPDTEEEERER